jgi:hypothetical protein
MKFLLLVAAVMAAFVIGLVVAAVYNNDNAESVKHLVVSAHCKAAIKADRSCTPGSVFHVSRAQICTPGWSSEHRNVSEVTKESVYSSYGITHRTHYGTPGSYEIDHLVPLELGGNNEVTNLWPEPYPSYYLKDTLEDRMHDNVCSRKISIKTAQAVFVNSFSR